MEIKNKKKIIRHLHLSLTIVIDRMSVLQTEIQGTILT